MKIAIVGSRNFKDYDLLKDIMQGYEPSAIVSGGATGADLLAEKYAKESGIKLVIFKPNWKRYGRAAGPMRNKKIVEASDMTVAFWDGKSRGTLSTITITKKAGKPVNVIRFMEE